MTRDKTQNEIGPGRACVRLLPYQQRWVRDNSRLKIAVKARQIGFSFAATLRAVLECLERRTTWLLLSKGERQSRLLMEKVQGHIQACGAVAQSVESDFFEGTSLRQLEARFPNGSVIYGLPANPETARGYSANVTLDEFAFHADAAKIYTALFPSVTRGYQLEIISTPNGQQGKFFEIARAAGLTEEWSSGMEGPWSRSSADRDGSGQSGGRATPRLGDSSTPRWSGHCCDIYEAAREGLQIDIPMLRAGCEDESAWQQEFCCSFVSAEENFLSPELIAKCVSAEARAEFDDRSSGFGVRSAELGTPDSERHTPDFFLGIDVGRKHDRTVFWMDEVREMGARSAELGLTDAELRTPNREPLAVTRLVRTMENAPFAEQLEFARELMRVKASDGRPMIRRAAIDATGIGAMLAETLESEFAPRVESVVFTAAVKEEMAYRTRRRMQAGLNLLPDTREVRRAFSAVKKFVTASGNIRLDAARSDSGHADEFWAKALADFAASARPEPQAGQAFLSGGALIDPRMFLEARIGWAGIL